MKRRVLLCGLMVLAFAAGPVSNVFAAEAAKKTGKKTKQVLFFTKSSGFEHNVIKQVDGQPSLAEKIMRELAEKNGFELTHSKDGSQFTPENLAKYDAFMFFTTGDLTESGTDKHPPFPAGGKEAFLKAIEGGKGFIGIHAASDTFHSGPDRFKDDGEATDPYLKMLGGEFIRHGAQQPAALFCSNPKFPGMADFKEPRDLNEEWYSFKNLAKDMHVLQWIGTWSLKNTGRDSVYRRGPYPVTWVRQHGKGRVFYTALGHRDDVWSNPAYQNMLVGAVKWTTGLVNAVVKPNAAQVTPFFQQMPPDDPPPPKSNAAAPGAPKPATAAAPSNSPPSGPPAAR